LSATSTGGLAHLPTLPLPGFLIVLSSLELPEDPITKHEAFEGAERRFDSPVAHDHLKRMAT
jgi:hypothetical protein